MYIQHLQGKGELTLVHKKLEEERKKLAEVAKETRQLEAAAAAAKTEAETAASQCLEQSNRAAVLLEDQQNLRNVLDQKRTAAQTEVWLILQSRFCEPCSMVLIECVIIHFAGVCKTDRSKDDILIAGQGMLSCASCQDTCSL